MADISYEAAVRRMERRAGHKLTNFEVILYLEEEVQELREKIKAVETITTVDAEFARFRKEVFKGLIDIYETLSEDEQRAFDLGELHGRLKKYRGGTQMSTEKKPAAVGAATSLKLNNIRKDICFYYSRKPMICQGGTP